jgi:N-acetylmuramoyl-L-alanine amidase
MFSKYVDVSLGTSSMVTKKRIHGRIGIALHSTEGRNSLPWLQGGSYIAGAPASCDYLVNRDGDILQLTSAGYYSYHLGVATWRGINNLTGRLNQMVIGIELESFEGSIPRYTDSQLVTSAALVRQLFAYHRLDILSVMRHGDVALPIGRRTDPVNFPAFTWTRELLEPSPLPSSLVFPAVMS